MQNIKLILFVLLLFAISLYLGACNNPVVVEQQNEQNQTVTLHEDRVSLCFREYMERERGKRLVEKRVTTIFTSCPEHAPNLVVAVWEDKNEGGVQ